MSQTIEQRLAALEAAVEALKPVEIGDIHSEWNNFVIRRVPSSWLKTGGPDYSGQRLSDTSPEFCDALAAFLTWRASKETEENKTYVKKATGETLPVAPLTRKDAARARAWARKLREVSPTQRPLQVDDFAQDELPF